MSAITDPNKIKKDDPANPDICMVNYYHKLISSKEKVNTICEECKNGQRGCVSCKKELIEAMNEFLKPIREKRKYYDEHPEEVDRILDQGTKDAKEKAEETMKEVRKAMKIDY